MLDLSFKTIQKLNEDAASSMPANVTGGGELGGTATMANTEYAPKRFNNCAVFPVSGDRYSKCVLGKKKYAKYADYVGDDEHGEAIRQYGRKNPKHSIIIQHKDHGGMMYLRRVNESKDPKAIAATIEKQLGGASRLTAMVGAYNRAFDSDGSYQFRIKAKAKDGINYIKITLNPNDLYNIEYGKIRGMDFKVLETQTDVYVDDMVRNIEERTGLALRL